MSSDISEVDEDVIQPAKKANLGNLEKLAAKGWNTCSVGFSGVSNPKNQVKKVSESVPLRSHSEDFDNRASRSQASQQLKSKATQRVKNQLRSSAIKPEAKKSTHLTKASLPSKGDHAAGSSVNNNAEDLEIYSSSPEVNEKNNEHSKGFLRKSKNWAFNDISSSFKVDDGRGKEKSKVPAKCKSKPIQKPFNRTKKLSTITEENECSSIDCVSQNEDLSSDSPVICTDSTESSFNSQHDPLRENAQERVLHDQNRDRLHMRVKDVENKKFIQGVNDENKNALKASDWLQTISWNKDIHHKVEAIEDKAHRPRKFVPGGFAEQAWKLENRERTSRVIWSHKKVENSKKWLHKCLVLLVQSCQEVDEFLICKCTILKRPVPSPPSSGTSLDSSPSAGFSSPLPSTSSLRPSQSTSSSGMSQSIAENCMLLLKSTTQTTQELSIGSQINVYSPWHCLKVPAVPFEIILCAYFTCTSTVNVQNEVPRTKNSTEEVIYHKNNLKTSKVAFPGQKWQVQKYSSEQSGNAHVQVLSDGKSVLSRVGLSKSTAVTGAASESMDCTTSGNIAESYALRDAFTSCNPKICICARVQRVWKCASSEKTVHSQGSQRSTDACNMSFSLLLQDRNSRFCELQLNNFQNISKKSLWFEVLHAGEGRCFQFEDVQVFQKLLYSKHLYLFSLLNSIHEEQQRGRENAVPLQAEFYKMIACCHQSSVSTVPEDSFPGYAACEISSMKMLLKGQKCFKRFSCVAKVICEVGDFVYLTDISLKKVSSQYIKVQFHLSAVKSNMVPGSVIFIKEAAVQKGSLLLDQCSSVTILSPASKKTMEDLRRYPYSKQVFSSLKNLLFFDVKSLAWNPLSASSRIGELVLIEGQIADVDRETAVSWLQCASCAKESLYEDPNCRIYCESCDRVISKTVLMMKMSVFVKTANLRPTSVNLELTCDTTKKLLKVSSEEQQPKCDVTDVLNKDIGPLICHVKARRNANQQILFRLSEIAIPS